MCTGNSCRSIMGEALINTFLDGVEAYSCGVAPSGKVNPHAQRLLEANHCWEERYHSKHLEDVIDIPFDLVVTVCDHAKETCPIFPKVVKKIHCGFEDPDGKAYEAFVATYEEMKAELLAAVKAQLC